MRCSRFVSWALLGVFMLASMLTWAQSGMSHEETVVRTAYARLTYAAQLRIVALDAMNVSGATHSISNDELQERIKELVPHFEIDNVVVGNLSAIAGEPWENFVTKPDGDLIQITSSGVAPTFTTPNGVTKKWMFYVMTGWTSHAFDRNWEGITVAKFVSQSSKPNGEIYDRYVSYRVQATLSGRGRLYNAMFLFGKDSKGKEAIHRIDHIVGMGSLDLVSNQSLYPEAILETYYRELPEIADWIRANTVSNETKNRDIYCSPSGCGLPSNWVNKSLTIPIDPATRELVPQ